MSKFTWVEVQSKKIKTSRFFFLMAFSPNWILTWKEKDNTVHMIKDQLVCSICKPNCCSRDLGLTVKFPLWGIFLKDSDPYLREFQKNTSENYKRLGQQAHPGIEPGTSRLSVLSAEPQGHWWVWLVLTSD